LVLTFLVLPFWYLLTRVVLDKLQKSSKTVVCVCVVVIKALYKTNTMSMISTLAVYLWM